MTKPAPKHRAAKHRGERRPIRLIAVPRTAVRGAVLMSTVAVATTGAVVSGGVVAGGVDRQPDLAVDLSAALPDAAAEAPETTQSPAAEERAPVVTRSDRRDVADPTKVAALKQTQVAAMVRTEDARDDDPREIGRALLSEFGFGQDQFGCLDSLWTKESNWRWNADNPSSSAYGIPQALPGSKMSSAGADWATNPVTQIRWGLGYIQSRYGSPCSAWGHSRARNWY